VTNKVQHDYQRVNRILWNVLERAYSYLRYHDPWFKKDSLKTSAWEGIEELQALRPKLSEPFLSAVGTILDRVDAAKIDPGHVNVQDEQFPLAAEWLTELAGQVDRIARSRHATLDCTVAREDRASRRKYVKMAKIIAAVATKLNMA
jgi:hypothetical protein